MILKLNKAEYSLESLPKCTLKAIGWSEKDLQKLLFENMEKVLQDEELVLIHQSQAWQEEPDLMALDKNGDLYIFELKAWGSKEENLLQALRYGQIYGQYSYDSLNDLFLKNFPQNQNLVSYLRAKFEIDLKEDDINTNQHFIIITNGVDFKTRSAVIYWQTTGVSIRSWIYRVYNLENKDVLIEFNTFRISEDPYEDVDEDYYILNTNLASDPAYDADMLKNQKAAAYSDPWKRNIERLQKNDKVFLYRSGEGIVALGIASGNLEKKAPLDDPDYPEGEYFMKLHNFKILKTPMRPSEIRRITGVNYVFMRTLFSIDGESGGKLWNYIMKEFV